MTGAELRKRRERLELTQAQLGNMLGGVSGNTIARWERDEVKIPVYLGLALETIERKHSMKPKK